MAIPVFAGVLTVVFSLLALRSTAITPEIVDEASEFVDVAPKIVDVASEIVDVAPEEVQDSIDFCATCVKVDSICYNRSYLFDLTANFRHQVVIKKMGILRANNVLYYSFEPNIEDPEYFKVAYVSLDSPTTFYGTINYGNTNVTFNFTVFDINQNENKVYLGGSDGIWYIDEAHTERRVLKYFVAKGDRITDIVSKDYVYFTKQDFKGIIKDKNGLYHFQLENKIIDRFVLDKDVEYTVVYLHYTGLYAFNSKTQEEVRLSTNRFFRGLTVDLEGIVYAWYLDGIYKVTIDSVLKHSTVRRVSDVVVGAMTFDNSNNIIYSKDTSLFRLTKTDTTKC